MKYSSMLFFIYCSFLYGAEPMSPDNYYPEDNSSSYEFEIEDPGESNSSFVVAYPSEDENSVEFYSLQIENTLERNDTQTGKVSFNREYNMSNPSDLDKWLQERSPSFYTKSSEISEKYNKRTGFSDNSDSEKGISALATDYIYEHSDQNSTRRRVIDSVDDIYNNLMAKISNKDQIKCYVSRKLKPGYMCPLPTMENSFILGYAQKDEKKSSMEACNMRCQLPKSCVSMSMPFSKEEDHSLSIDLWNEQNYEIDTNVRQTIKKVSFNFHISDLNQTKLDDSIYQMRYGVEYYYAGVWHQLFENYKISLFETYSSISFYLNRSAEKIRLHFFSPFERVPKDVFKEIVLEKSEHEYILDRLSVSYTDDSHWFCPNTQYVYPDEDPSSVCPNGTIKDVEIGSVITQVCIPKNLSSYRDEEFGAYKSKFSCESECIVQEECIPTYRQPGQLDYNGFVPENYYDIEIGCIDSLDNAACTQEICEKLFLEDSRPIEEKVWTNNDEVLITVQNSSRVDGVQRPKIDIAGELSSNGEEKEDVFKTEMKDSAYVSMLNRGTYNVSSLPLQEEHPQKSACDYKYDAQSGKKSLTWLVKAKSKEYDNDKEYSFYPILAVDIIYHPIGAISVGQNYIYGETDSQVRAIDRIFLVKTNTNWQIFKRVQFSRMYTKDEDGSYSWKDTMASATTDYVLFDEEDADFKAYDRNMHISAYWKYKLNSDTPFERLTISLDIEYLLQSIRGILFSRQDNTVSSRVAKIYSLDPAEIDESSRAFIYSYDAYGLYYDHDASIEEIIESYEAKQFFSSLNPDKYPAEIKTDSLFSDENVKLYIHGNLEKFSVNADFKPDSEEENKKAFFFIFLYDK